jgi:hypothetical protein
MSDWVEDNFWENVGCNSGVYVNTFLVDSATKQKFCISSDCREGRSGMIEQFATKFEEIWEMQEYVMEKENYCKNCNGSLFVLFNV